MNSVRLKLWTGPLSCAGVCMLPALLMTVASNGAFAADSAKLYGAPQVPAAAPVVGPGSLLQVMFSLLLVLAAVFAAAWVMRRLRGMPRRGQQLINIIADVTLGAKERAVLLQVGKDQVLVGVAPGQVTTLHVLSQPLLPGKPVISSGAAVDFDETRGTDLDSASGGGPGSPGYPSSAAGGQTKAPTFKSLLRQSLGLK